MTGLYSPHHVNYFDYNATSPLNPVAREAWLAANEEYPGNPSSLHRWGQRADRAIEKARAELAEILGCISSEIIWTSGATESANLIVHQLTTYEPSRSIFISAIEHPCLMDPCRQHLADRLRVLPVTADGVIDLAALTGQAVRDNPAAIILMAANNETGAVQPWEVIRDFCAKHGILFICDAVQWLGKLPAEGLGKCDIVFGSGHKFGAPKGTGFLKIPARFPFSPMFTGGNQEFGFRSGTENVAGILAFLAALCEREMLMFQGGVEARMLLQAEVIRLFSASLPEAKLITDAPTLWNTISYLMPEFDCRKRWVVKFDKAGYAVSSGSACASGNEDPSHVLLAMGLSPSESGRAIRFSSGWETTLADWQQLAEAARKVYEEMKSQNP